MKLFHKKKMIISDQLSLHARDSVCICYRNSYPLKVLSIHYLLESAIFLIVDWIKNPSDSQ